MVNVLDRCTENISVQRLSPSSFHIQEKETAFLICCFTTQGNMFTFSLSSLILALMILLQTYFSNVNGFSILQDQTTPQWKRLRPLRFHEYESTMGIRRRTAEQYDHLMPKSQVILLYTLHGPENFRLGNMTLEASNYRPMVLLERIESLIDSLDCDIESSRLRLRLKSELAFKRAVQAWSFVNAEESSQFLLLADHDHCKGDINRQPFL